MAYELPAFKVEGPKKFQFDVYPQRVYIFFPMKISLLSILLHKMAIQWFWMHQHVATTLLLL